MKRKFVRITIAVTALMMVFAMTACKKNETVIDEPNQEIVFLEEGNKFALVTEVPKTEVIEKELTITPYQSATITIKKNISEGELYVDINADSGMEFLNGERVSENEEVITINGGSGVYNVRFDFENFVGTCDVLWDIKDVYTAETHTSPLGYTLDYIPEKFDFSNENGRETFTLKEGVEGQKLYFSTYIVETAEKDAVKANLETVDAMIGDCIFDEGKLNGKYSSKSLENGLKDMDFMFDLADGRMLVIETLQGEEFSERSESSYIKELIKTFSFEQ